MLECRIADRGNHAWHVAAAHCFLNRGAEVLAIHELGARDNAAESGVVRRTRQQTCLDVLHIIIANEVVRHALVGNADCLLDQSLFLEVVRVD